MKNDSFTALRQIILTSGTLLKEDLHKVCSLQFVCAWVLMSFYVAYKYGKVCFTLFF